ncbi:MAG TPA: SDR family oxidoreductase [Thermoleophilaceae bacterium]|nr:SDR family oxidoreductase [Thermoleophilaceae bacterium]
MSLPPSAAQATALVTGASAGIGRELARGLASRGHGVTLVARRADRLKALACELAERHGIRAEAIAADLSDASERERVATEIDGRGLTVEILVNNAGFGIYRPFADSTRERELEQVRLLVEAVVDFDARYVPGMVERGRGAVVNIASTAGFQPLPGNGTYSASKSFVLFHTEALHEELRGSGVTVTAVCPGPVETEFQETSEPLFMEGMPKQIQRGPEQIAAEALEAVERGKRTVVPGGVAVRAFFGPNRVAPAALTLPVARRVMARELRRARHGSS